jgi:hypothetical protein
MSTIGQGDANATAMLSSMAGKHVCPFCGMVRPRRDDPCPRCTMEDTAEIRQATRNRIGPWYVLQSRNPSAPGMKFDTLLLLVRRGQVTPRSIIRGPTTYQLWRFAIRVRGLSREWGLCYSCGKSIELTDNACPHCHKLQEPPLNPDLLLETPSRVAPPQTLHSPRLEQTPQVSSQIVVPMLGGAQPVVRREIPKPDPEAVAKPKSPAPEAEPVKPPASPPAPRQAGKILSPKDLAAAFSLDFNAASQMDELASPRRGRRIVQVLLLLLLVGVLGGIAALVLHPPFREQLLEPVSKYVDGLKDRWRSLPATPASPTPAPSKPAPKSVQSPPPPSVPVPQSVPPPSMAQTPNLPPDQHPLSLQNLPLPRVTHPIQSTDVPEPAPAPALPADKKQPPPPKEAPAVTPEVNPSPLDRSDQVRQLWIDAIDAEGQGDLPRAIKIYEKIKSYPSDFWPVSLDLRLEQARKQLKK